MTARRLRPLAYALGVLLLLAACLLLADRPATGAPEVDGADVVICLDVSRSMLARDVAPDRLTSAQVAIQALAQHARGDRIGLVIFAGEARMVVPRTQDLDSLAELAALTGPWDLGRGGTDFAAALRVASDTLGGPGTVFVLSDGEDLTGAQRVAVPPGVRVHTLGYGSARGAKIPIGTGFLRGPDGQEVVSALRPAALRALATATGGTFALAAETSLVARYDELVTQAPQVRSGPGRDLPLGLLVAAFLCLGLALGARGVRA